MKDRLGSWSQEIWLEIWLGVVGLRTSALWKIFCANYNDLSPPVGHHKWWGL